MLTHKRLLIFILLAMLAMSGCARDATRSGWSPIAQQNAAGTATLLPATLLVSTATATAAVATYPATAPAGTFDVSTLPAQLPDSMKGYELYSWQTGSDWNFTLITGTNRTKSFDEIIAPGNSLGADGLVKISVNGVEDLKKVLQRLPKGESILWGGMDLGSQVMAGMVYLTFPPQQLINEVTAYCASLQLNLTTLKTP